MITVKRYRDEERLRNCAIPVLIYGRRKTGKTYLAKKMFRDGLYFFVRRDRSIFFENNVISYNELRHIIAREKEKIIVDEFHRLPDEFLDYIHMENPKNLVLVTSTLHLARKLISHGSPLLGLFSEFRLDIIDERDILENLEKQVKNKKELVEGAVYLREPILLRYFKKKIWNVLPHLKLTVPALIGEVFREEDREYTARYEGIVRAIASGKNTTSEITAYLFKNKLIDKQDSGQVKPYLVSLAQIGIVRRIREYGVRRYRYFIASPMVDLYYYLDEKYNFSEQELPIKYFKERIPRHVEFFIRDLLSKIFGKRPVIYQRPNKEVDIMLLDFKRISIVGEVKWKKDVDRKDVFKAERNMEGFDAKKILIVPDKTELSYNPKEIEVWDVYDLLTLVKNERKVP